MVWEYTHVELKSGELGVMRQIDAFIPFCCSVGITPRH